MKHLVGLICIILTACASTDPKNITSENWEMATEEVVQQYTPDAHKRLLPYFEKAEVQYPPKRIEMLAFKKEGFIELWAQDNDGWHYIKKYYLTASSGKLGPKLKELDHQIPEGIYKISHMNPFSNYHLSMMLDYPNYHDRMRGKQDGRDKLGYHIFIHGDDMSAGCLAVGNRNVEELFVLVHNVGMRNTEVIIAPKDFRRKHLIVIKHKTPEWLPDLYQQIALALQPFDKDNNGWIQLPKVY